mmetsp:Transcript_6619/g.27537  ORF Transcript_6619/g.27537 Transcript_6619/m.27537 type:complete len:294 (-) Transcript_6619:2936-3817(-)
MHGHIALQAAAVAAIAGRAAGHDGHMADLGGVAVGARVGRASDDQRAAEAEAEVEVEKIVQVAGHAEQCFAERTGHAVDPVEQRQAGHLTQFVQYRQIAPALQRGGPDEAELGVPERAGQGDADAPEPLGRLAPQLGHQLQHRGQHLAAVAGVHLDLAAAADLADEIHQGCRCPARFQADADGVAGLRVQFEGDGRLAPCLVDLLAPRHDQADGFQVVGDVGDGLRAQGHHVGDILARRGALLADEVQHDAAVEGRAGLLGGSSASGSHAVGRCSGFGVRACQKIITSRRCIY